MYSDKKVVSKKIKIARVTADLSQDDLAKKLNYDRQVIMRMEAGNRKVDIEELKKIAEITKQPISFFYEDEPRVSESQRAYNTDKEYRYIGDLDNGDITVVDKIIEALRAKKNPDK